MKLYTNVEWKVLGDLDDFLPFTILEESWAALDADNWYFIQEQVEEHLQDWIKKSLPEDFEVDKAASYRQVLEVDIIRTVGHDFSESVYTDVYLKSLAKLENLLTIIDDACKLPT